MPFSAITLRIRLTSSRLPYGPSRTRYKVVPSCSRGKILASKPSSARRARIESASSGVLKAPACNKKRESSAAGKTLPFSAGGGAAFGSVAGSIFGGSGDTAFAGAWLYNGLFGSGNWVHVLASRPYLVDERHRRVGDEKRHADRDRQAKHDAGDQADQCCPALRGVRHVFGFVHMRCGAETPSNPSPFDSTCRVASSSANRALRVPSSSTSTRSAL
jgi:hypothetical protein